MMRLFRRRVREQEPDLYDEPSVLCTERELVFLRLGELEARVAELEEAAGFTGPSRQGALFDWPERRP